MANFVVERIQLYDATSNSVKQCLAAMITVTVDGVMLQP